MSDNNIAGLNGNWRDATPMTGSHIPGVDTGARHGSTTCLDSAGTEQSISSGDGSLSGGRNNYETLIYNRLAEQ